MKDVIVIVMSTVVTTVNMAVICYMGCKLLQYCLKVKVRI